MSPTSYQTALLREFKVAINIIITYSISIVYCLLKILYARYFSVGKVILNTEKIEFSMFRKIILNTFRLNLINLRFT